MAWLVVSRGWFVVVLDPLTLVVIVLMAVATYATRAGGLWIASRLDLSERAEAWLEQLPGAILVSLVAPAVLTNGPAGALAAVAVMIVASRTGSLPAAMVTGVLAIVVLRNFL